MSLKNVRFLLSPVILRRGGACIRLCSETSFGSTTVRSLRRKDAPLPTGRVEFGIRLVHQTLAQSH